MRKTYIPRTYKNTRINHTSKKPNRFLAFIQLLILLGFIVGVGYCLYSPIFNIETIQVRIDNEVLQKDINSKTEDFINSQTYWWYNNKNIFLSRTDRLENYLLQEFPQIKGIEIKRNINRSLELIISLRSPLLSLCVGEQCYDISDDGINLGFGNISTTLISLTGIDTKNKGESVLSAREIQWLKTIIQEYNAIDTIRITSIVIEQKSANSIVGIHVYTEQGYYIMLDLDTDIIYQAEVLKQVFISQIPPEQRPNLQYIDLRVKDRVYYKFK